MFSWPSYRFYYVRTRSTRVVTTTTSTHPSASEVALNISVNHFGKMTARQFLFGGTTRGRPITGIIRELGTACEFCHESHVDVVAHISALAHYVQEGLPSTNTILSFLMARGSLKSRFLSVGKLVVDVLRASTHYQREIKEA